MFCIVSLPRQQIAERFTAFRVVAPWLSLKCFVVDCHRLKKAIGSKAEREKKRRKKNNELTNIPGVILGVKSKRKDS